MSYRKDQLDFYHTNVPIALDVEHALATPHDITIVTLGQIYAETAAKDPKDGLYKPGLSPLYLKANNPFGMRYYPELHGSDPLPPYSVATDEYVNHHLVEEKDQLFRHFETLHEAYVAHHWLFKTDRYAPAMRTLGRSTVEKPGWQLFALALGPLTSPADWEHCGYSTDPQYGAKICALINEFRLFDPRALAWYASGKDPGPLMAQIAQMEKSA